MGELGVGCRVGMLNSTCVITHFVGNSVVGFSTPLRKLGANGYKMKTSTNDQVSQDERRMRGDLSNRQGTTEKAVRVHFESTN